MSTEPTSSAGTGGHRVLITGLSTYWGGRLAQALERDPDVDVIVGVSPDDPTCELTRTEYVRVGDQGARFTFRFCPVCGTPMIVPRGRHHTERMTPELTTTR